MSFLQPIVSKHYQEILLVVAGTQGKKTMARELVVFVITYLKVKHGSKTIGVQ
jgi:hypothetical protein